MDDRSDGLRHFELNAEPGSYSITRAPAGLVVTFVFVVGFGPVETEPVATVLQALDVDDPLVAAVDVVIVVVILLATWKMTVRLIKLDRDGDEIDSVR